MVFPLKNVANISKYIQIFSVQRIAPIQWPSSGSDGKESACNAGNLSQSLDQEDPLENGMATHSNILAWRIMDRGALWVYSPWDRRVGHTHTHTQIPTSTILNVNIVRENF